MSWVKAFRLAELPVGQTRTVELAAERILVCRLGESDVHALEDVCSHDDGPLGEGILEDFVIECPRHGARFDVKTGAVLRLPAASPLLCYPTRVGADGWVEVELEER
jgi:3-phenylpropionate/trans-cinnamate dioxygenase ferredoxin subunit